MWRIVSSYSDSLAPGLRFSKHLSDSAKASSTVQPLLIMMPVQDFEFMTSFCQAWPNFVNFWDVTHAALRSALRQLHIRASEAQIDELMQAYLTPLAFQDVTFRHSTHQSDPP